VIHFGLIPRAHRSIFVINELPDLQARIQVALFNMLQEGDIQIRGFKLRLPLEVQFLFTANPEDYTNRGSIITPLKDRIESQILTHYPRTIEIAKAITSQESNLTEAQENAIEVPELLKDLLETISFEARESEYIDEKSGVSARLSIAGYENLVSAAERRMLINNGESTIARITDFWGVIPAITGKVELVYEGEQEGPYNVALRLMSAAIKQLFLQYFPNPEQMSRRRKQEEVRDPYGTIKMYFSAGNTVDLLNDDSDEKYKEELLKVAGLEKFIKLNGIADKHKYLFMELVLHGLVEFNIIGREFINKKYTFKDMLSGMLSDEDYN
jgi:magnesium chelatase subunit I